MAKQGRAAWTATVVALILAITGILWNTRAQAGGCDDPSSPCLITNIQGLENINDDLTGYYTLDGNIDASGFGFNPIGSFSNPFTGSLSGNGFSIENLTINSSAPATGLFGDIGTNGNIQNILVTNANIASTNTDGYVGGIAGENDGTITGSYFTGQVTGSSGQITVITSPLSGGIIGTDASTGGLVGYNFGTISQSFSTASVTAAATGEVGGLVGNNRGSVGQTGGTILQSYATGQVVGGGGFSETDPYGGSGAGGEAGSLVGINTGTITETYGTGEVLGGGKLDVLWNVNGSLSTTPPPGTSISGQAALGGLVGFVYPPSTVTSSYWDTQATEQTMSAGGTPLTTAQLQSGTLPAGFDPTVWSATPGQYPTLIGVGGQQSPQPSLLTLAYISQSAEQDGSSAINGYNRILDKYGTSAFHAQVFQNGNQLVVTFQGTQNPETFAGIKTLLADDSFETGSPSFQLQDEVAQAANLVADLHTQYRNASITLTGHSLGGAIAQLVGFASGYTTDVFDAPGTGLLYQSLTGELAPAERISGVSGRTLNVNYRIYGDQVSLESIPLGNDASDPHL